MSLFLGNIFLENKTDLAIVLKSVRYKDRHRIVTAITKENGKITALAKNSIHSRRFGSTLDSFTLGMWHFNSSKNSEETEIYNLIESQQKLSFDFLKNDFKLLTVASIFSEILINLSLYGQKSTDLFKLHFNALSSLETCKDDSDLMVVLNSYFSKSLQWSGVQPRLKDCISCQTSLTELSLQEHITFSIPHAGWVCLKCKTKSGRFNQLKLSLFFNLEIAHVFLKLLSLPIKTSIQEIKEKKENHLKLFKILEGLLFYHIPGFDQKTIKSLKLVSFFDTTTKQNL